MHSLFLVCFPHLERPQTTPETFARSNEEMMHSSIETVREQVTSDPEIAPSKKSREIVTRLHEMGIFDLKDKSK